MIKSEHLSPKESEQAIKKKFAYLFIALNMLGVGAAIHWPHIQEAILMSEVTIDGLLLLVREIVLSKKKDQ